MDSEKNQTAVEPLLGGRPFIKRTKGVSYLKMGLLSIATLLLAYGMYKPHEKQDTLPDKKDDILNDGALVLFSDEATAVADGANDVLKAGAAALVDPSAQNIGAGLGDLGSLITSVGMASGNPVLAGVGGIMMLTGAIFGVSSGPPPKTQFQLDLEKNLTIVLQNQERMLEDIDELREGQIDIVNEVQARAARAELGQLFNTFQWDGPLGMTQQGINYQRVQAVLKERLIKYRADKNGTKLALAEAASMASLLWDGMLEGGFTTTQTWENMAILIEKVSLIHGESSIGRWTAARVFQQYVGLRFESYYLEMMAQVHKDKDLVNGNGSSAFSSKEQERIFEMLDYDIRNVKAWAFRPGGIFEYPKQSDAAKNCSGHLHNDILWEPWEVQQCLARFGSKKHNKDQPLCCEMFNSQPSGKCDSQIKKQTVKDGYYFNSQTKRREKCDWRTSMYVDKGRGMCLERQQAPAEIDYIGWDRSLPRCWGGRDDKCSSEARDGYLLCGVTARYNERGGDEVSMTGIDVRWCSKTNWADQYGESMKVAVLERRWPPSHHARMCPQNTYVTEVRAQSEPYKKHDWTAMNGIKILCQDFQGNQRTWRTFEGQYGGWSWPFSGEQGIGRLIAERPSGDYFIDKVRAGIDDRNWGSHDVVGLAQLGVHWRKQTMDPGAWMALRNDPWEFQKKDGSDRKGECGGAAVPATDLGWSGCTRSKPCGVGQGDCDGDQDCLPGLKCYDRAAANPGFPPGVYPIGNYKYDRETDFCYDPKWPLSA